MKILESTRKAADQSVRTQIILCLGSLILGILLGVFQKYLDISQAELPSILGTIDRLFDLHNFFGEFLPWIVAAVCLSVYSASPIRAGVNVFSFFTGMVSSYYLYSYYVGGFFPRSYALLWVVFTVLSPLLAFLCWYARGKGWLALLISTGILAVLINMTFSYGLWYFHVRSFLHFIMLLAGTLVLHKGTKETLLQIGLSIPLAILLNLLIPYGIW